MIQLLLLKIMKTSHALFLSLIFISLIILLSFANFNQPSAHALDVDSASIALQDTPIATAEDASEIGSTDGILIMGMVIVVIVIVPVLFYRRK